MEKKVLLEHKRRILDDFFKVDEALLKFEKRDGSLSDTVRRLSFERGDSVSVVMFNSSTNKILLVKQFKYPTLGKGPGWIIETAAGMIDDGESFESAARREVLEETGYSPSKLEHISTFYLSPGGSSERIILFYAKIDGEDRAAEGGGLASENEDIETVEIDIHDALAAVERGSICDAKTILSIFWLRDYLREHPGG